MLYTRSMQIFNKPALYFVTPNLTGQFLLDLVLAAIEGGATIVQFRNKIISDQKYLDNALLLKKMLSERKIPLVLNDRVHLVLEANAEGVHIGQNDRGVPETRKFIGPDRILGLSIESAEDAQIARAWIDQLDYIAASPVFLTSSKSDTASFLGIEGVRNIKKIIPELPLAAIGGINTENIDQVHQAGADYLSVISAIANAPNPQQAARELFLKLKIT
jgi:thiamine-phosphate pyrophosphorylase